MQTMADNIMTNFHVLILLTKGQINAFDTQTF